jgi:coenzyme F420-0:L-glutamate ligase/coenzyme F420-1:gamma-L-glutamate ligase
VSEFRVLAVTGIGEVDASTDLAAAIVAHVALEDGDIVVVTSKVVSKAEGRVTTSSKAEALAAETDRVVARRGDTAIVRTRHGLVMAAAGIDASNTVPGSLVVLPEDPDASAARMRARMAELSGRVVGVVVSDTSGRAWRAGQTDIAVGAAGIRVLDDHAGRSDGYGNVLAVTAPALADELAGAGDLVKGKLGMTPVAVVRGLADLVLPVGTDGPGARALVREEGIDMFGLGAREAVMQALEDRRGRGFGDPAPREVVVAALRAVGPEARLESGDGDEVRVELLLDDPWRRGRLEARLEVAARAHGWEPRDTEGRTDGRVSFLPALP